MNTKLLCVLCIATLGMSPIRAQLTVQWITHYGTTRDDMGNAIAVDALGRSWVSGGTAGDLGGTNAGGSDLFLTRLSPSGGVDFTRQRGTSSNEQGNAVALVGSGTVFAGATTGSPTSFDGQSPLGGSDGIAVRYDANGTWQGTTRFGGTGAEQVQGFAGNATYLLAAGYSSGSFDGQTNLGGDDAFLSKRDSSGAVMWTRLAGTVGIDQGRAATSDNNGQAYLAGYTSGGIAGVNGAGLFDLFVARYDATGNRNLLKQFGTSGNDYALDVAVDLSGNIYLSGNTSGSLNGQISQGGTDAFLMKLDSAGNVLWTRLFGGSSLDTGFALGLDGAGHVWLGGYTNSDFSDHINAGSYDAYVAEYDPAGALLGTTFLATAGDDEVSDLAIAPNGAVRLTGYTTGALGGPNLGGYDIFVAEITGVPEPTTAAFSAVPALALIVRRRRS